MVWSYQQLTDPVFPLDQTILLLKFCARTQAGENSPELILTQRKRKKKKKQKHETPVTARPSPKMHLPTIVCLTPTHLGIKSICVPSFPEQQ